MICRQASHVHEHSDRENHPKSHKCAINARTQEEYVKDETKNLKRELLRAQEEVKRIQSVPLVIGQFLEMIDANHGVVSSTAGSHYYVRVSANTSSSAIFWWHRVVTGCTRL
jgi:ATP-dependent 26S proteasome regulatory subunit